MVQIQYVVSEYKPDLDQNDIMIWMIRMGFSFNMGVFRLHLDLILDSLLYPDISVFPAF